MLSVRELLEALRDAVTGHRSLLEDRKILYWDVSKNNIIITKSATKGAPKGNLIDLDLAKELDSIPSGASHQTGTMQFIAIKMCIRYGHKGVGDKEKKGEKTAQPDKSKATKKVRPTKTSILQDWYIRDYKQIANTKRGHIVGFKDITIEFAP
ncbi:hypothetical protein B0J14DRAFT_562124 [Halenospora varia]|nr:hypothetical protein B0J14DRAFT_562124 [Halenospora varia]